MDALLTLIKIFVLVAAAVLLTGSGICAAGSVIYMFGEPGAGVMMLGLSLLFAIPSFFVARAMWRSLKQDPQQMTSQTAEARATNKISLQISANATSENSPRLDESQHKEE